MTPFAARIDVTQLDGTTGFVVEGINPFFGNGVGSGGAVSPVGDLNGDGIGDFAIGAERGVSLAPGTGQQRFTAGEVYVVFGTAAGFPAALDPAQLDGTNGFRILGGREAQGLGFSLSGAGDVNGDGVDDLLLGTRATALGQNAEPGEAFILYGKTAPFDASFDTSEIGAADGYRLSDTQPSVPGQFGRSVSNIGDFDGDGIDDFAIGEAKAGNPFRPDDIEQGAVHIVLGTTGTDQAQIPRSVSYYGPLDQAGLGTVVSGIGDFNGDGLDDVIAMAPGAPFRSPSERFATVIFGDETVPATGNFSVDLTVLPQDASEGFLIRQLADIAGTAANAGDVNGDGLDDLIIGGPNARSGAGIAYVIFGTATPSFNVDTTTLDGTNGFTISGNAGDFLGNSVHAAGDVNNDGFDDVIVGAIGANTVPGGGAIAFFNGGAAYVIFGGPTGGAANIDVSTLDGMNGFEIEGISPSSVNPDDALGTAVSGGTDVNGDGIDDILIGAPDATPAPGDVSDVRSGRTYVIFGQDTVGPAPVPVIEGNRRGNLLEGSADADTIRGFRGNDTLRGAEGDDLIEGGPGADRLVGAVGADTLEGGADDDVLIGNRGADVMRGNDGRDRMLGGPGDDTLVGGGGIDTIDGGGGDDTIRANRRSDLVNGGDGDDRLDGGHGNDSILGDGGADTLIGGDGDDTLDGNRGDDLIEGRGGRDVLLGGRGDDTLEGGRRNDVLTGGAGEDRFIYRTDGRVDRDTITDFADNVDTLALTDTTFATRLINGGADLELTWESGHALVLEGITDAGILSNDTVLLL